MRGTIQCYLLLDLILSTVSDKVILLNTTSDGWKNWQKNTEKYQGWRIQNLPPNGDEVYGVCDLNQRSSNSWLRSPFISRQKGIIIHIKVSFTMRECKSYPELKSFANCEDVFHLLKYETDFDNDDIQYNEKYFVNVETILSHVKWEDKDRTENILNIHESATSVRRTGFIIAFRNTGSCVMIKEVVVYYVNCPALVSNFVSFPQAATGSGSFVRNIEGQCVDGALRMASAEPMSNLCRSTGKWSKEIFPQLCECGKGYVENTNKTKCLKCDANSFKFSSGNSTCIPCSKNSYSLLGAIRCHCNSGYYEIPSKGIGLMCRKPPLKPRNLHLDASDQARIILTWDTLNNQQSPDNDTKSSLKYSIVCVNCPTKLVIFPSANTTGNKVIVHGALPSREYSFKVTTENYVTQYVTNAFDIDQSSASRVSVLTSPLENMEIIVIDKAEKVDNSISMSWVKPKSSSHDVEYECVLFGYQKSPMSVNTMNPDIAIHSFIFKTQHIFEKLNENIIHYIVKVRWRNTKGWGQFSETKSIEIEKVPDLETNIEVTKQPEWVPDPSTLIGLDNIASNSNKDVILVIVGAILLVVVLVIVVVLVSYCIRRQMLFSAYRMKIKKTKYESSNPAQMIYSSAYSLPLQSYVKYHDPSTYEDISIALQDFTKEIDPNWITMDALVGQGEFGDVFSGMMKIPRSDEKPVAIKILKVSASQKEKTNFLIEASTMGQFLHENIVRLQGVVSMSEPYMIVTDYMVNGALLNYLVNHKGNMRTMQQLRMLSNVAAGMRYLASMGFIHRDLAARNILLDSDFTCKIADFGLSRELASDDVDQIYQNKNEMKIPIKWTSPEAILYQRFSQAGDVWSFGVLAWEILSYGEKPYWQWSNQEVIDAIQSGYRLPPPVNCPPIIHNLMLHCWNSKPEQRPTFTQLYFEVDQLISRLHSDIHSAKTDYRREYKSCEKAHLLRHCIEPLSDGNTDIIAPHPPPRNVVFDSRNAKFGSTPDAMGFSLTLTRKASGCGTNPSASDLKMKEPVMTLSKNNGTVVPLQSYYPHPVIYQPCLLQPDHEYRSYNSDLILSADLPNIPPHKVTKGSNTTVDEFLVSIHNAQYISLLHQVGIHSMDQLRQINSETLRSWGIVSKEDRETIVRALQPPMYC